MVHAAAPYPPAVPRDVRRAGTINSTAFLAFLSGPQGRHHDRPAGSRRSAGGRLRPVAERTGTAVGRASPPDGIGRNVHTEYR
jgi:hypothetical protein